MDYDAWLVGVTKVKGMPVYDLQTKRAQRRMLKMNGHLSYRWMVGWQMNGNRYGRQARILVQMAAAANP